MNSVEEEDGEEGNNDKDFNNFLNKLFGKSTYSKFTVNTGRKLKHLTKAKCVEICKRTRRQSDSALWHKVRAPRLTASKAHKISRAKTKKTRLKYFFEKVPPNVNCQYGIDKEPEARESYVRLTGNKVVQVGSMIRSDQQWLSASPDGLVMPAGSNRLKVLEIKCPISCKNAAIRVPYLSPDGKQLKKNHAYYEQVQLQMYVAGARTCDFFVFSDADEKLISVPLDTDFLASEIPWLEKIYFEDFLPEIQAGGEDGDY